MPSHADVEEHELPSIEAVLAGTLALMTGYSQALQAEVDPQGRIAMGDKIGRNLAMLIDYPQLSPGFRRVVDGLRERWVAMGECSRSAGTGCGAPARTIETRWAIQAPKRLQ